MHSSHNADFLLSKQIIFLFVISAGFYVFFDLLPHTNSF